MKAWKLFKILRALSSAWIYEYMWDFFPEDKIGSYQVKIMLGLRSRDFLPDTRSTRAAAPIHLMLNSCRLCGIPFRKGGISIIKLEMVSILYPYSLSPSVP